LTGCVKSEYTQLADIEAAFPNCEIRKIPNNSGKTEWLVKTPANKIIFIYFDYSNNPVSIPMY